MHQASTWLLLVASFFSHVNAFYPYHRHGASDNAKRYSPEPVLDTGDGLIRADLHKVRTEKRNNKFSVLLSNPPTYGPNALAIDQDGSDFSYFSSVKIGSQGQSMYLLIDTGSANTWVFSSDCTSASCEIHNTFAEAQSTSLSTTQQNFELAYGTGEVSGIIATDTVAFANFSVSLGFGLVTNASDDFNNYPMDGILGLGRRTSDQLGSPTIMDVLSSKNAIAQELIGVHLNRAGDNTKDGEIVFGGIDTTKFSGSISYTKTSNDDAWEIPVGDFVINNVPCNFTSRTAIVDTGTTFILLPPGDATFVHNAIPGSSSSGETFTIPCNTKTKIEVSISGKKYAISPADYVGKPVASGSATCNSNIIGHQAFGPSQWILGDVFLKNVYSVFDYENKQIGLGMPGTGGSLTPSPASSAGSSSSGTTSASNSASSSGSATTSSSGAKKTTSTPDSSLGGDATVGAQHNAAAYNAIAGPQAFLPLLLAVYFVSNLLAF